MDIYVMGEIIEGFFLYDKDVYGWLDSMIIHYTGRG